MVEIETSAIRHLLPKAAIPLITLFTIFNSSTTSYPCHMRLIRFDPTFSVMTLLLMSYVVYETRAGGDPTKWILGYLILTSVLIVFSNLYRLFRYLKPSKRGIRVR